MMMICWVYSSTKKRDVVHSGNCCFHIGCLFLWPQKLTPLRPFLFHPPFVLSRAESYIVLTKSMWFLPKLPSLPTSLYLFTKKFCVEGCLLGLMMGLKGWFAITSRTWLQEKVCKKFKIWYLLYLLWSTWKFYFQRPFPPNFPPFILDSSPNSPRNNANFRTILWPEGIKIANRLVWKEKRISGREGEGPLKNRGHHGAIIMAKTSLNNQAQASGLSRPIKNYNDRSLQLLAHIK